MSITSQIITDSTKRYLKIISRKKNNEKELAHIVMRIEKYQNDEVYWIERRKVKLKN